MILRAFCLGAAPIEPAEGASRRGMVRSLRLIETDSTAGAESAHCQQERGRASIWAIVLLGLVSRCEEEDNMRKPLYMYTDELRTPHSVHSPQTGTRARRSSGLEPAVGKIRVGDRAMYDGSRSTKNPPEVGSGAVGA
jgi:hypothetical protein